MYCKKELKVKLDALIEKIALYQSEQVSCEVQSSANSLLQLLFQMIPQDNRSFYIGEGSWNLCEPPFIEQSSVTLIYENKIQEKEITIEVVRSQKNTWIYYPCQYDPGCHENIRFKEISSALASVLSHPSKFDKTI